MVKSPKTQGKTSKLKEKTQNSRKKLKLSEFWYSPSLQTGVKKNACFNVHVLNFPHVGICFRAKKILIAGSGIVFFFN